MENLETLKQRVEETYAKFYANTQETINAITSFINMHCCPEGFELNYRLNINEYEAKVSGDIEFITDDPERIKKGWKTDFGSDFDFSVSKSEIKINKGTIGSYTIKDKFQVARDRLICSIWDNHDIIVGIFNNNYNQELANDYKEADRELERAEDRIKAAKEEAKKQELLNTLKKAKFLVAQSYRAKYKDDDWNKERIGTLHYYYNYFIIDKITDKSILGRYETYHWENKRLDLEHVLYQIQTGNLLAFEERPEDYIEPLPSEETSTK